MKKLKKILGILAAVIFGLVVVFGVTAIAIPENEASENIKYTFYAIMFILLVADVIMFIVWLTLPVSKGEHITRSESKELKKFIQNKKAFIKKYYSIPQTGMKILLIDDGEFAPAKQFIYIGEFDLGAMGVCQGQDIYISSMLSDIRGEYPEISNDDALKKVETTISEFSEKVKKYSKQLFNYFLANMFDRYNETDFEFWHEYKKEDIDDKTCAKLMDAFIERYKVLDLLERYRKEGLMLDDKTDLAELIQDELTFFDYQSFFNGIKIDGISFNAILNCMSVQISDKYNDIFCGAYDEFDENLLPQDYHNF